MGGWGRLSSSQRKARGWKQNYIYLSFDLSGCTAFMEAELHQRCSNTGLENFQGKSEVHEVFKHMYWWLYRAAQGLNQNASEDCRPELIWLGLWGSALWSYETKFQFLSLSPSLLFMDGLSFRLMCKPDSYQSSRPNPASVIVLESLKCLQKCNFHPCGSTSDAKCYKPVKGQCWSTGSEAVDMFYFIPHVRNTSIRLVKHKPCTTMNTLHP